MKNSIRERTHSRWTRRMWLVMGLGLLTVTGLRPCFGAGADAQPPKAEAVQFSVFAHVLDHVARERHVTRDAAARLLYAAGVRGFDGRYNDPQLPAYAATVLKPINLYGFMDFYAPDGGKAQCAAFVAAAVRYRVPRIMCVPSSFTGGIPNAAEYEKNRAGLATLVELARPHGVCVTIEDFGNTNNPCSYTVYLKRFLTDVPALGFALDSGNLYYASRGEDVCALMDFAQGRIAHVHLKDLLPTDHHAYATLGLGGVPNRRIVQAMSARGYDQWYTLENMVGNDQLEDVVRQIAVVRYWLRGE